MKENSKVPHRRKTVKFTIDQNPQDKCARCNKQICNKSKSTYIQPPRQKSLKPIQQNHLSEVPFSGDTIYKKSYYGVSHADRQSCRPRVMKPVGEIERPLGKIPSETVFTMSYQPHRAPCRRRAFLPKVRTTTSTAPFHGVTTHMHDFVPKRVTCRSEKVIQMATLRMPQGRFSSDTINRLSYAQPQGAERVLSLKPKIDYRPPSEPMEGRTVHRMSYQPTQLPQRETYPWMKKDKVHVESGSMEKDTIYRKSFFANPNFRPPKPIKPSAGGEAFHMGGKFYPDSVYKMSYYPQKIFRVPPILPKKGDLMFNNRHFDGDTVHKLSYSDPMTDARRQPLRPIQRRMISDDPMEGVTTHMRDFVPRSAARVQPCRPKASEMSVKNGSLSSDTTQRLSYMPPDMSVFKCAKSCKPPMEEFRSKDPFDDRTINKMSYQAPAGDFRRASYGPRETPFKASGKVSGDTIQSLSYGPPGDFVDDDNCCCCRGDGDGDVYPKAGI